MAIILSPSQCVDTELNWLHLSICEHWNLLLCWLFPQLSHSHREHYNDKSGTAQRVDFFMLPTKAEDQFKKHLPL